MRVARATSRLHNQPPAAMNKKHTHTYARGCLLTTGWQRRGGSSQPPAWNNMQFACFGGRRECARRGCEHYGNGIAQIAQIIQMTVWKESFGGGLRARRTSSHTQLTSTHIQLSLFVFVCELWLFMKTLRDSSVRAWQKHTTACVYAERRKEYRIRSRTDLFIRSGSKHKFQLRDEIWAGPTENEAAACWLQSNAKSTAAAAIGAENTFCTNFSGPLPRRVWALMCNIIFICGSPSLIALAKQGHVGSERLPHMEIDFSDFLLFRDGKRASSCPAPYTFIARSQCVLRYIPTQTRN